jgi:hypothetical protein
MPRSTTRAPAAIAASLIAASPALAHRGFRSFDRMAEIELTGVITGITW